MIGCARGDICVHPCCAAPCSLHFAVRQRKARSGESGKRSPGVPVRESGAIPGESEVGREPVDGRESAVGREPVDGRGGSSPVPEPTSFREQLEAAGMDLTGNPLLEKLDAIAAVPVTSMDERDNDDVSEGSAGGFGEDHAGDIDSNTSGVEGGCDDGVPIDESVPRA